MPTNRPLFNALDRVLLGYAVGAAFGVVVAVFALRALDWPVDVALFLVPVALGWHAIGKAYRAGLRAPPQERA